MDLQFLLKVLILLYLGVIAALYLLQWFFFYHPERLPLHFRFQFPEPFREVLIPYGEDHYINGIHFVAEPSRGIILYFKGNTRSIKGWSRFRRDFLRAGFDFFLFDYPGFGKSSGRASQKQIFDGTDAVYAWLKERVPEERIVIYGRSLGGGFAARIAALNRPALLILDAPYYSVERLAEYYTRIVPVRLILRLQIPVHQYLHQVKCRIHLIHGDRDRVIPFRFSQQLRDEQPDKVTLHPVEGAHHNDLPRFPQYHRALNDIFQNAYS
jgi:fermentation-respiration switch protein FrsA (DUF1100 family)